ncbi:MAG: hypothetical protein Q9163_001110 [Psora crenata]
MNLDIDAVRERFLSRDLTAEPEEYHDYSILEPRPIEHFRSYSLSEELHRVATSDMSIDLTKFNGHRDTFAMLGLRRLPNRDLDLPPIFYERIVQYVNWDTYRAIRLTCHSWTQAITWARPIQLPPLVNLPAEILGKIYAHLKPEEFNAARHTCRAWMIASLEERLLVRKLQAGGWWSAATLDMARYKDETKQLSVIREDWLLSKRLATECALMPGWWGNGLEIGDEWNPSFEQKGSVSGLMLTSETTFPEFNNLLRATKGGDESPGQGLTVSVCQNYFLTIHGSLIYLYSIRIPKGNKSHVYGGSILPVTRVECFGRALDVSMDTSSERYSIAAVLEGRKGLLCDLDRALFPPKESSAMPMLRPAAQTSSHNWDSQSFLDPERMSWAMDDIPSRITSLPFSSSAHTRLSTSTGIQYVYRGVCSLENPPSSVAICPNRRYVAFANSAGVELHLINALSGEDVKRWFPLPEASDCLYFVPNRKGAGSRHKLRLASSAVHPEQVRPNSMTQAGLRHYQVVPITDGFSFLFTHSATGQLCLGDDAGAGQTTAQLTRRFILEGPNGAVPHIYTAGAELRWGVRVTAAFGENLWLFTVPADIFLSSYDLKGGKDTGQESDRVEATFPIRIKGIKIAEVPGLTQLAVDATDGDLTIWAFSNEGKVSTWQIAGSTRRDIVKRAVLDDGTVAVVTDGEEQDVEMQDWERSDMCDVELDSLRSHTVPSSRLPQSHQPTLDADGDTLMADAEPQPHPLPLYAEDEGYASGADSEEHHDEYVDAGGHFAIRTPPIHGRWSESDADWVPDYLAEHGPEIEDEEEVGMDLLEWTGIDLEVIGY